MIKSELQAELVRLVADQAQREAESIGPETRFVEDLEFDSLDTIELILEVEDHFDVSIPDTDAEALQTVAQAIDYLAEKAGIANG